MEKCGDFDFAGWAAFLRIFYSLYALRSFFFFNFELREGDLRRILVFISKFFLSTSFCQPSKRLARKRKNTKPACFRGLLFVKQ